MFKIKIFVSFFFMFFFFNPTEAQSVVKRKIDGLFVLCKMARQDRVKIDLSQEKYNIICLFCLVTLIFLSIAIYFLFKNKKHTKIIVLRNIELEKSRALIEESLKRKEVLLKEIHHRVKNNFQIIISLFNIQARQDKGISVKDFLEKGEARIATMALIHENLYQTNDLEKVKLQEYFENLIRNLLHVFGTNHLTVSIHAENIFLDIQTSVSLGLIVNELMLNVIKYAFPESQEGNVTIRVKQINEGNYQLFFEDDGVGIDSAKKSKKSLGLTLVGLLVQQIEGTISSKSVAGTAYEINFKDSAIS